MPSDGPAFLVSLEDRRGLRTGSFAAGLAINTGLVLVLALIRFSGVVDLAPRNGSIVLVAPSRPLADAPRPHRRIQMAAPQRTVRLPLLPAPVEAAPPTMAAVPPAAPPKIRVPDEAPAASAPPRPASTTVVTGTFASAAPSATAPKLDRGAVTQIGSFAREAAPAQSLRPSTVQTGSFGASSNAASESASRPAHFVASAFEAVAGSGRRGAGLVAAVAASGFDEQAAPVRQSRAAIPVTTEPAFRSVEILTKPKPEYSDEARKLRIEGEVWIEVLFCGDGRVRIQRILQSLGHGLDENAARAAAQIRFRPAASRSGPIDQIATVRIQFQLAN